MIKSMTGFASVTRDRDEVAVTVTIKTVNHRFLDIQVRVPAALASLEASIRGASQKRLSRGRVEIQVTLQDRRRTPVEVTLNDVLLRGVVRALAVAKSEGLVTGDLTPTDVLRLPDALAVREVGRDPSAADTGVAALVEECLLAALDDLEAMRRREGGFLHADLDGRRQGLGSTLAEVETAAQEGRVALEARLTRRVGELALEISPDPVVLAQEVVRFAARSDISEELVRFRAHLVHWALLMEGPEPCGRKLDFLLQEMNREVNTIGAKAEGEGVSEMVVDAKADLERMREQVQNVE